METVAVVGLRAGAADDGLRTDFRLLRDEALDRIAGLHVDLGPGKTCTGPVVCVRAWARLCARA
eukprot:14023428-Alexandrium_andersonii.AAC.1